METTVRGVTQRLASALFVASYHVCVVAVTVLDQQWLGILHFERYCCYATILDDDDQLATQFVVEYRNRNTTVHSVEFTHCLTKLNCDGDQCERHL